MNFSERVGNLVWILLLAFAAQILVLDYIGLIDVDLFSLAWDLWPLLLIAAAVNILLTSPMVFFPLLLLAFGGGLLLSNLDLASWNMWLITARAWPMIFVTLGLDLLVGIRRGSIDTDLKLFQ